jgi:hypothetical protein
MLLHCDNIALDLKNVGQSILRHFKKLITGPRVRLPQHGPWEFKKFEIVHRVIRVFEEEIESKKKVEEFRAFWKVQEVHYSLMSSTAEVVAVDTKKDPSTVTTGNFYFLVSLSFTHSLVFLVFLSLSLS